MNTCISARESQPLISTKAVGHTVRYGVFVFVRWLVRRLYRFEVSHFEPWPDGAWADVNLLVFLNHTSLWEPLFAGAVPHGYLRNLAWHGTFPAADVTMMRPWVGKLFRVMAPKVVTISRKRDASWEHFLGGLDPQDTLVFMPEGRMKRANGLDKHGNPMTVRGGIVDVLLARRRGRLIMAYSGGLHHILPGKRRLPQVFKTLAIKFEALTIEDYLAKFSHAQDDAELRRLIIADLEARRDRHC